LPSTASAAGTLDFDEFLAVVSATCSADAAGWKASLSMLAHSMSLHQLVFEFGRQRMMAEESFVTADRRYHRGTRVVHPLRGPGYVSQIDYTDSRNRPFVVDYDNGECHHYTAESVMKLAVQKDAPVPDAEGGRRKSALAHDAAAAQRRARRSALPEIRGPKERGVRAVAMRPRC
jgi:hypothetical protein